MNLTLLITVGVPIFIIFAIIYSDKFREPTDLVIKTFFAGVIICFPAAELNYLLIPTYEYSYRAGFTEETLKFLVLYFYIRPKVHLMSPWMQLSMALSFHSVLQLLKIFHMYIQEILK